MEKDLHKIFHNGEAKADGMMSDAIWMVIKKKKDNAYRLKVSGYGALGAASIFGSFFSFSSLITQFSQLGFSEYFSLIFSDTGLLVTYWREYLLTLVESVPFTSLALSLFLLFVVFISVERLTFQVRSKLLTA